MFDRKHFTGWRNPRRSLIMGADSGVSAETCRWQLGLRWRGLDLLHSVRSGDRRVEAEAKSQPSTTAIAESF
jgi:hypothetical protein